MEHKGDSDTHWVCCTFNNPEKIGKGSGKPENKRANWDHPDYCIIKIGRNTERNTGDLKRLAVSQKSVRNHPPILVRKTLIGAK